MNIYLIILLIIIIVTIFIKLVPKKKNKKKYDLNNWFIKKMNNLNKLTVYKKIIPQNIIQAEFKRARDAHEQGDGINAIKDYLYIYNTYNNPYVLIDIGDIFQYGSNNTEINKELSTEYYNMFLVQTNSNTPVYYVQDVFDKLSVLNDTTLDKLQMFDLYYHEHDLNMDRFLNRERMQTNTQQDEQINTIAYVPIVSDPQNVHDTRVNHDINDAISKLQISTPINYSSTQVFTELSNKVDSKVLKYIFDSTEQKNDLKLQDLLTLVYNRIKHKNLDMENLIISLNSCIENNTVVCFTGVYNRIIDSINVIDDEVTIKSKTILNQEILDTSAKISMDHSDLNPDDLKTLIIKKLKETYVDTSIMSQKDLDSYVSTWIDYI